MACMQIKSRRFPFQRTSVGLVRFANGNELEISLVSLTALLFVGSIAGGIPFSKFVAPLRFKPLKTAPTTEALGPPAGTSVR